MNKTTKQNEGKTADVHTVTMQQFIRRGFSRCFCLFSFQYWNSRKLEQIDYSIGIQEKQNNVHNQKKTEKQALQKGVQIQLWWNIRKQKLKKMNTFSKMKWKKKENKNKNQTWLLFKWIQCLTLRNLHCTRMCFFAPLHTGGVSRM